MVCPEFPQILVTIYRELNTGDLLALLALISAAYIPFALFLIEGSDKTDAEKDVFKVERAVIVKYVMHMPFLIAALLFGGLAALIFIDSKGCELDQLVVNTICGIVFLASVAILMWTIRDVILWIHSSAKADNINSFRFKKWKKYLEALDDSDFESTWRKIFSVNNSEILQPAYLSIFLEKVSHRDDLRKFSDYNILLDNIKNLNLGRPDVLEAIINGVVIDDRGIQLLSAVCDGITKNSRTDLFFALIDKKVSNGCSNGQAGLIVDNLIFRKASAYSGKKQLENLLAGIPNGWKLHMLLKEKEVMPIAMARSYIPWLSSMIRRQEKDLNKAVYVINEINDVVVGDYIDEDLDKRFLADYCEIYGQWFGAIIPTNDGSFEKMLVDDYLGLGVRYFAAFNSYTAYGEKDGEPDFAPSIRCKELGTYKILTILFPEFIGNKRHIARMKKEIESRLKDDPQGYRLKKMLNIYKKLDELAKKKK